jgi:AbrB family looped-hinge helix DNA binding protein
MIVTASSKYQIVIPKTFRDKLGIRVDQKFSMIQVGRSLTITPVPDDPIEYLCGALADGPSLAQELLEERRRDLEHE